MTGSMTVRRTDDPNICFMKTNGVALWCYGIVEFKVDRRQGQFIMTPVMRDGSEGPVADVTEAYENFLRERA